MPFNLRGTPPGKPGISVLLDRQGLAELGNEGFKRPRALWPFTGLFVGLFALGCSTKPTPEKVCQKVFALLPAPKKNEDTCIKDFEKTLREKPEVFQCFATCIDKAKIDLDLRICEMNCNDLGGERDEMGRRKAYSAPSAK